MQKRTLKNSDVKNNTTNNIATISLNHFTILLNISGYCLYMGFDNSLFAFFGTKGTGHHPCYPEKSFP